MTKKKEKKEKEKVIDVPAGIPGPEKRSITQTCEISLIDLTGWNPRGEDSFKDEAFEELKQSMKENGFFKHEPLLVRPAEEAFRFQLIAGHRRLQAAKDLGFTEVPVSIQDISDPDAKLLLFIDNFHRKDFSPLEEAQGIKLILDDGAINQTELGKKMGKSQAYVANRLRLLDAPEGLKALIISQEITPSHANLILPFSGYPIFKDIEKSVRNRLKAGPLPVKDMDRLICNVFNNFSDKLVLNLDSFPFNIRDLKGFFDFSDCYGVSGSEKVPWSCKDTVIIKNYSDGDNRRCLNQECWISKIVAARKKFELAEEKRTENLLKKDQVDTSKMAYGTYEKLNNVKWDQAACSLCENCKKNKDDILVCLDVNCYKKKEKTYNKEQSQLSQENAVKAWEICDKKLAGLVTFDTKILRAMLSGIIKSPYFDVGEKALAPWNVNIDDGDLIEEADISKIPDIDIPKVMIRLLVASQFEYDDPTVETMEKFLDELGV